MGINKFQKFMNENFRDELSSINKTRSMNYPIDTTLIDAQSLIYGAIEKVFGLDIFNFYTHLNPKQKLEKTFDFVFDYILNIIKFTNPQKTVFIAFDGPAPIAKQYQQRQRRFRSALEDAYSEFSKNAITPGTDYTYKLCEYISSRIRFHLNSDKRSRHLNFYFSSTNAPCEGEHKLMNYIRELSVNDKKKERIAIVGDDNDLVMLGLISEIDNIYIIKNDMMTPTNYKIVNIAKMKIKFEKIMREKFDVPATKASLNDLIRNFVFIFFFVGNDFLPTIPLLIDITEGTTLFLGMLAKTFNDDKKIITSGNILDKKSFQHFLKILSLDEEKTLKEKFIKAKKLPLEDEKRDLTLLNSTNENGDFSFTEYRKNYYNKLFERDWYESDLITICFDYIKTLQWNFKYYSKGVISWNWLYKFHYTPLVCDLYDLIDKIDFDKTFVFDLGQPMKPFLQLLYVLPRKSVDLLPECLRPLMLSEKFDKYHPEKFKIDLEGKIADYMGKAIIPYPEVDFVKIAYDEHIQKHKGCDLLPSNQIKKTLLYKFDKTIPFKYVSDYGIIEKDFVTCYVIEF